MLKDLIKLANHLDSKGLNKEADYLDEIIKRSSETMSLELDECNFFRRLSDGNKVTSEFSGSKKTYRAENFHFTEELDFGVRGIIRVEHEVVVCDIEDFSKRIAEKGIPESAASSWIKSENDKLGGKIKTIVSLCGKDKNGRMDVESKFFDESMVCLNEQ